MRVTCPACSAAYEVPEAMLGSAGRRLRCARCQREWTVDAQQGVVAPVVGSAATSDGPPTLGPMARLAEVATPVPPRLSPVSGQAAVQPPLRSGPGLTRLKLERDTSDGSEDDWARPPRYPEARNSGSGAMLAWVLSLALVGTGIGAAYLWRVDVMHVWPPSERIYAALGLH